MTTPPLQNRSNSRLTGWILWDRRNEILEKEEFEINALMEAASEWDIEVEVVDPRSINLVLSQAGGRTGGLPDFYLQRLGSQADYFDIAAMEKLEQLGVHAVNNARSVELCGDKWKMQQALTPEVPCPDAILVNEHIDLDSAVDRLGFPVVVKKVCGSHGAGIKLEHDKASLRDLLDMCPHQLLLQQFLVDAKGTDLRCFVAGNEVIAGMQRSAADGEWKSNASNGAVTTARKIDPLLREYSLTVCRQLGLEIAGVDLVETDSGYLVLEANSSPGFRGLQRAHPDLNVASEIWRHVRNSFATRPIVHNRFEATPTVAHEEPVLLGA